MLVATSGQAQTLAGMRDMIWSINTRSKDLRDMKRELQKKIARAKADLEMLQELHFPLTEDRKKDEQLAAAIKHSLDQAIDQVSRELMRLRLATRQMQYTWQSKRRTAASALQKAQHGRRAFTIFRPAEADAAGNQFLPSAIARNELPSRGCRQPAQSLAVRLDFSQPCPGL